MTENNFQIRWKNGTHSPTLTRKINEAMEPSIRSLMKAAGDSRLSQYVSPEALQKFCVEKIRFGWKTQTRTTQNHATAYGRPDRSGVYRIMFNPISLLEWLDDYSPELLELRLIDIMMHEIAHILVGHFMKGRGHGWEWKTWAHLAGFVPFSGTSNHKRNVQAVVLHHQHRGGDRNIEVPAPKKRTPRGFDPDVFVDAPKFPPGFRPGNFREPLHSWRIGDRVEFVSKRGLPMPGTVIRVNRKSISVQVDGEENGRYWRVSPALLRKLESAIIDPTPEKRPDRIMDLTNTNLYPKVTEDWAKGQNKPADLVRAGIRAGLENPEIVETLRRLFPDYRAYKIACSVYRRELRKKGEIA